MNTTKVVLVTTTFSKTAEDLRFRLALRTCDAAKGEGYSLVVVDASSAVHQAMLRTHGAMVYDQTVMGMGASRRQALEIALATDAEVIVWIEPEKYPLVPLLAPSINGVLRGEYDVVIPARKSLESLPPFQEVSELRANRDIGFITGRPDLDLMFGPRIMNRSMTELMLKYTGQSGGDAWEILFIPIIWALQQKMKVGSCSVDYTHPPEQTALERGDASMDAKRDHQRSGILQSVRNEIRRHIR